jgi:hypothetical protein
MVQFCKTLLPWESLYAYNEQVASWTAVAHTIAWFS